MVLRGHLGPSAYIISVTPHSVAVMVDERLVVAHDTGGRLYSVYRDGHTFRRGLSGYVLEKWRNNEARGRRSVVGREADTLVNDGAAVAAGVLAAMDTTRWTWDDPLSAMALEELRAVLTRAARFDAAAARSDASRFNRVYRPVGILPPDQYLSLVVQATEGCSFNTCTFCDLYHDGYRVKTGEEFRRHVSDVRAYLGASAALRARGIFLGAANALAVPMARLREIFECLAGDLEARRVGVSAFVDGFTGTKKQAGDYADLRDLGLRRVYIGLESGHDPLLAFVRKPGAASDAIETVAAIKEAGVHVGIIVMVGLGGVRYADGHVADTLAAINGMHLGQGDLLYFSDLVEVEGTPYPRLAAAQAIAPLTAAERREQERTIRGGLRFAGAPPQLATYDIREFVY